MRDDCSLAALGGFVLFSLALSTNTLLHYAQSYTYGESNGQSEESFFQTITNAKPFATDNNFNENNYTYCSACLLIKDDNDILPEWIAYHYHALQLRSLIVAVDPHSTQSPSNIIQKYNKLTNFKIQQWDDDTYMPDEFIRSGTVPRDKQTVFEKNLTQTQQLQIAQHRYRQRVFYAKCLQHMRDQGGTYVMHIDTDEYAVLRKGLRGKNSEGLFIPPMEEPNSVWNVLQQYVAQKPYNVSNYPCIPTPRILFGSDESPTDEINRYAPQGFNATMFETLRWKYHAPITFNTANGMPKYLLDVSAIPEHMFPESRVFSIHRPIEGLCPKPMQTHASATTRPITINHYLGSLDHYNARNDKRRNQQKYWKKAKLVSEHRRTDDGIRPWLQGFVQTVGRDVVAELLGERYLDHNFL